jgi:integrase
VVDRPSPDGRRRQVRRRGFATKRQAQDALALLLADGQRGLFVPPDRVTLGVFLLEEWLPARRSSLRPSTGAAYEPAIRNYVVPRLGAVRLQAVDGSSLNRFYDQLLTEGRTETRRGLGSGLAPKTVRNVHGVLTKAFRDGVRWGRLQRNPCDAADPPRGQVPEMKAWSADQLRQFTRSVADHRWGGIWALMSTTGMRRGEVLGLRWGDIDLDAGTVTIRSTRIRYGTTVATSTPKTARGNRTIALGPATVAALRVWRRAQAADRLLIGAGWQDANGLVVTVADGSAPNPEAISNLFHKLARRAGLPPIRLHDLRHSYATAALAAGVPVKVVSQRVGHADVGVTLKVYAHVMPGDDEEAALRADALLAEP